jgi:hypothetical protein
MLSKKDEPKGFNYSGKTKTYYTIYNGIHPYKIVIDKFNVYIFAKNKFDDEYLKLIILKKIDIKKIWIGKNTAKYSMKSYKNNKYEGSTILLEFEDKCIYIGNLNILSFNINETIIEFHSIMGNNLVVYPFILTENYAYCFDDKIKRLDRDFGDIDPYIVLYDFNKKWNKPVKIIKSKILNTFIE